ncbi:MAG: ABC transporter ATP-binding protein [Candidatus Thorarchaeota archaeon]
MSTEYAVELEGISKTFPGGVQANKDVTLRIRKGEVIGLLGENGAGKSTLMNVLYGLLRPDEGGRIVINGTEVDLKSPQDAIVRGVGMVHQHFKLIPVLTVTENVVLGLEPILKKMDTQSIPGGNTIGAVMPIDFGSAAKRIKEIGDENGLPVDPDAKIHDLSVGVQQRVEIIKMLYREADILILDEPTAVLTPHEVDELFVTLKEFVKGGKTIILITHKLRESIALCDRICVLRDGELAGLVETENTSPEQLAQMMVGRPVVFTTEKELREPGEVILSVRDLHVLDNRDLERVKGVNFEVHAGEIFGIAGVQGNGQSELVEAITGLRRPTKGRVCIKPSPEYGKAKSIFDIPIIAYFIHGMVFAFLFGFNTLLLFDLISIGGLIGYGFSTGLLLVYLSASGRGNAILADMIWHLQPRKGRSVNYVHGLVLVLIFSAIGIPVLVLQMMLLPVIIVFVGFDINSGIILWFTLQILISSLLYGWICKNIAYRFSIVTEKSDIPPCIEPMVDITRVSPRAVRETGMSHIPEDRHKRGIILPFAITENMALGSHYNEPYAKGPLHSILALEVIRESTEKLVKDYSIRLSSVDDHASTLSGGNQQKVVVARQLATNPVLVIAAQPTRGLDVGATEYIHEVLIALRDAGVAVLLISAELDEIQNLADRIGVIYDGQIVAVKAPGEATPTELGLLMAGHSNDSAKEEV